MNNDYSRLMWQPQQPPQKLLIALYLLLGWDKSASQNQTRQGQMLKDKLLHWQQYNVLGCVIQPKVRLDLTGDQ